MIYSNRTPKDRERFDAAVLKKLGGRGQTRGEVYDRMSGSGFTPRMVSDSLKRLVKAGKATREGKRNAPVYSRAGV